MSTAAEEELPSYTFPKTDDPAVRARQKRIAEWLLETVPEVREEAVEESRAQEARAALRGVLKACGLALGPEQEARVDACADLATLRGWINQAVLAPTAADALR